MKRMFKLSAVLAGMAVVGACGSDGPTGNSGDQLTETETQEIAAEILSELGQVFLGGGFSRQTALPPGLSLSQAAVPISYSFDETAECEGGGSVSVEGEISGDVNQETFEGDLEIDITESITNCVVEGESITATVNGAPNIRLTGTFEFGSNGESYSADYTYVGGFSFETDDGRSGTCGIDITSSITVTGTTISASTSGSMCGISVNNEFVYGGSAT